MTTSGAFLGLSFGIGWVLIVSGLIPRDVEDRVARPRKPITFPPGVALRHIGVAIASMLIISALTKWWAVGLLAAGACLLVPMMVAERASHVAQRVRLVALAGWVESVRDLLAAASGIEEAIAKSAETLSEDSPVREPVWRLRAATDALGLREGLRRFGEEIADPVGDYIAATLLVASERPSAVVHAQLSEAAQTARESVSVRERIEASRARMWTASSTIAVISLVIVGFVIGTQPTYAAWYASPAGQMILLACGLVELVGMWWTARSARPSNGHRVVLFDPPTYASKVGATR